MVKKPVAWSHTSLTQFVNCPSQYHQVKVLKKYPFIETPETKWGNLVHKALENRLLAKTPLPGNMIQYEPLMLQLDKLPGKVAGEQQLAVRRANYEPVSWFDKDAWCRGIVDAMWIDGSTCYAVDYKTGKYKADNDQLALFAGLIFQHYPAVQNVHTKFLWLQEIGTDKQSTGQSFNRNQKYALWDKFLPTVERIQEAVDHDIWPKRQSGLCGWCPVKDCENWYERRK